VPLYTYVLTSSADYGVVANLYAWTALLLVILTYGMETGLFRFLNKDGKVKSAVYPTTVICLFVSSLTFVALCAGSLNGISTALGYPDHQEYVMMLAVVVAMDAFDSIPFAYLRYKKRPIKFAALKLLMIFVNIVMNIFFLVICPMIYESSPEAISWFYNPNYGVGYVFVANLISTTVVTLALIPVALEEKLKFDLPLLEDMLKYSFPLLALGVVGIMNQTIDKILYPFLLDDPEVATAQLGIYGACFKVAMVMMMFTQAFRYAYEPFVFAKNKDKDSKQVYADSMKYYVISSLLICLGMIFYIDILKLLIHESYWSGLIIIPVVLLSYLFQGIYFNLSLWYKLVDKTYYGAIMSSIGFVINVVLLIVLVPLIGFMGAALASLAAYTVMMIISYFLGNKYFPINYPLLSMAKYLSLAAVLVGISYLAVTPWAWLNYIIRTILLGTYIFYIVKTDFPLSNLPIIGKYFKK
jgi:O-antigen/teichoic acid export membrane protein